jgi:hypothetical protein
MDEGFDAGPRAPGRAVPAPPVECAELVSALGAREKPTFPRFGRRLVQHVLLRLLPRSTDATDVVRESCGSQIGRRPDSDNSQIAYATAARRFSTAI